MKYKGIKILRNCPACGDGKIRAYEPVTYKGNISGFHCEKCDAKFDSEIYHAWEEKRHFYLGLHRNPAFWTLNNITPEEGYKTIIQREAEGIKPYLNKYVMAEILYEAEPSDII